MVQHRSGFRLAFGAALVCGSSLSFAQLADLDPDWKELDAPAPPAVASAQWLDFSLVGSDLRFGIDTRSVTIGRDGVVRYVLIARGTGQTSTLRYEALRCATLQARLLARYDAREGWTPSAPNEWVDISNRPQYRAAAYLARSGLCNQRGTHRTGEEAVHSLRQSERY